MLRKYWIHFVIVTVIVSLISIKGFPLALGALYLPLLFKIVQLQLNLSKGLIDNVNVHTFIKVISLVCDQCDLLSINNGVLTYTLDDFYNELPGFLGVLVSISPVTLTIGVILFVLTAIAIVQATKAKYQQSKN